MIIESLNFSDFISEHAASNCVKKELKRQKRKSKAIPVTDRGDP
jgi:hypothetical protein